MNNWAISRTSGTAGASPLVDACADRDGVVEVDCVVEVDGVTDTAAGAVVAAARG